MNQESMLEKIMGLEFQTIDLGQFLDTHPEDARAAEKFEQITAEVKSIRDEYEQKFGALCMQKGASGGNWNWLNGPWPWEKDANIKLEGGM